MPLWCLVLCDGDVARYLVMFWRSRLFVLPIADPTDVRGNVSYGRGEQCREP
jgi:hypothetical protein